MNSETQVMKIKIPELFYLFRKAFGLICLCVFNICCAQIPQAVNSESTDYTNDAIHITTGTYIFDSAKAFKPLNKEKTRKLRRIAYKATNKVKLASAPKTKVVKYRFNYHYYPQENTDVFFSVYNYKTTCPNTNNSNYKFFQQVSTWSLVHTLSGSDQKINSFNSFNNRSYPWDSLRVRPPPENA